MEHDPALSKTLYYVIAVKPCETCRGEGYIEHPAWVDYYREHRDARN